MNFLQITLAIQDIEIYLDELKAENKIQNYLIQTDPVISRFKKDSISNISIIGVSIHIITDESTHHSFHLQPAKLALKIFLDGLKANENMIIRKEELVCH